MTEISPAPVEYADPRDAGAPTASPGAHDRGQAAAAWLAETFRGVTWMRVGLFLSMFVLLAAASWPTARAVGNATGLANMAESFVLTFVPMVAGYGIPTLLLIGVTNRAPPHSRTRSVALIAVVVLGSAVTAATSLLAIMVTGYPTTLRFYALWIEALVELGAVCGIWLLVSHRDANRDALRRVQLDRIAADRRLTEARVMTLQAQIEPHFLFNALANVRWLLHTDRAAGRAMLRQLSHYLEATLPALRDTRSSLGRELAQTAAYLDVQRIRMGARLTTSFDVPAALRDVRFPPMMLMTLVENAIKHGIAPLPEGGKIAIAAEAAGVRLRVCVRDSGAGFRHSTGKGIGIANTRARLRALYGDAARLSLSDGAGGRRGVTAIIELPLAFERQEEPVE